MCGILSHKTKYNSYMKQKIQYEGIEHETFKSITKSYHTDQGCLIYYCMGLLRKMIHKLPIIQKCYILKPMDSKLLKFCE